MRASLLLLAACTLAAGVHAQQSYPARPVKLIVADAPGSRDPRAELQHLKPYSFADKFVLLPLYGVVAAAAVALAWDLFGEAPRARELGKLSWPLALFVGWQGLTLLWSNDVRQGSIELLFFVLPFSLLAVSLARLVWSSMSLRSSR